jgi:hypothetical protein
VKTFPHMRRGAFGTVLVALAFALVAGTQARASSNRITPPAYGTVTGRVIDLLSKLPVSTATITIGRLVSDVAVADKGGFVIRNVPVGTHELRIDAVGWARYVTTVTVQPDTATDIGIIALPSSLTGH